MEKLDVFTVRELRQRTGDLLRDAEEGRLALITKHDRPAFLAVPFDERLLKHGVNKALALHLFQARHVTLSQEARISFLSIDDFLDLLSEFEIPAVDYPPEDLDEELEA
jgi:antitoxin (DNA-binding transcriptional repressor) of toxin-antitoxin stability system